MMPDLSDKLREYMQKQNISQAELSERSNISKTQISNILMKKACPRIDTIQLICNALKIDISCLFKNDLYMTDNIDGSGGLNRVDESVKSKNNISMTNIETNSSLTPSINDEINNGLDRIIKKGVNMRKLSQYEVNLLDEQKVLIEFINDANLEQIRLVNQFIKAMRWDEVSR